MRLIDEQITTRDGFTFTIVDVLEETREYVVRADAEGRDMALAGGQEGVDWMYVYIAEAETVELCRRCRTGVARTLGGWCTECALDERGEED